MRPVVVIPTRRGRAARTPVGDSAEMGRTAARHPGVGRRGSRLRNRGYPLAVAGIMAIALLVRFIPVITGGGLTSYGRYDDGVYYSAADSLLFGRLPYRDFVLLHPPGLMLALVPFAELGRLTTDATGLATGRVAFMVIGAVNAALVALMVARWTKPGGVIAGLFYACWMPAVLAEQTTLLEPLGTTAVLVALLLLAGEGRNVSARAQCLAGAALGVGLSIKIWSLAPVLVILGWQALRRDRAAFIRVVAATVGAATAIMLPFFALAPGPMFRMVVRDQLLRPRATGAISQRFSNILGLDALILHHPTLLRLATVIAAMLVVLAALVCLRRPSTRILVALLAVTLAVLSAIPTYFAHYAALSAAPIALVAGVACGGLIRQGTGRSYAALPAMVLVTFSAVSGVVVAATPTGTAFARHRLSLAASTGCVAADDPTILIDINKLSADLRAHCPVPVDVTGITYDRLRHRTPGGILGSRKRNRAWQHYLISYLTSAHTFVLTRQHSDGLSRASVAEIRTHQVLAFSHGVAIRSGHGPA